MGARRDLATRALSIRALRKGLSALKAAAQSTPARHSVLDLSVQNSVPIGLCALGIMTKAPRAGAVKTRLQPPLTAEEAAALNVCFLRDIAAAITEASSSTDKSVIARGVAVFTPLGSEADYEEILPAEFNLLSQRGTDFGERLTFAAEDLFRAGFESCCLINSDSPAVTADAFRTAVCSLHANDDKRLVLGPSDDGGYYLIGMKKLHRRVFENIDWSTERVFEQTIERAREIDLKVETLPAFFDVDDGATLRRLCEELFDANQQSAPATKEFLEHLIAREGRKRIWTQ
jgi:rSAM/selenodomain-associated transferase 1